MSCMFHKSIPCWKTLRVLGCHGALPINHLGKSLTCLGFGFSLVHREEWRGPGAISALHVTSDRRPPQDSGSWDRLVIRPAAVSHIASLRMNVLVSESLCT